MMSHLPVLIVLVPLLAALIAPLLGLASWRLSRAATTLALASVLFISIAALRQSLLTGPWHYHLGGWEPPWGIELVIDPLSGLMATLVSGIALLAAFYSGPFLDDWTTKRRGLFYSVYLLLVVGLEGIVVTGDLFNLYVFLEISSLAAYALLSSGGSRAVVATFRYLLVGTVAASFYLLGVGYLYAMTGTLNMADMSTRIPAVMDSPTFVVALAFIVIGLAIKSALFPLHGWLPDAYTYASGPVVGFIAAVMAKVSAYALFRILFFVFGATGAASDALAMLGWASVVAVIAGSIMALVQTDIQRMLAYSSIGQMGYIMLGFAIGTPLALTGALLHIVNHAIMKGCLFLSVNGAQWKTGIFRVQDFAGSAKRLPLTMAAFSIAAISMIGLPPTAGFFSKYYLAISAIESGQWVYLVALLVSSLLGAIYFFRVIEHAYLRPAPRTLDGVEQTPDESSGLAHELPLRMLIPIWILALAVLLLGLFNQSFVEVIVSRSLPV